METDIKTVESTRVVRMKLCSDRTSKDVPIKVIFFRTSNKRISLIQTRPDVNETSLLRPRRKRTFVIWAKIKMTFLKPILYLKNKISCDNYGLKH